MNLESDPALRPDLFGQLAATDPFQQRSRRLFERGQVIAVHGNEADLSLGLDARNNAMELKGVPVASGYVPRVGDWVAIRYEAGHSGAPWVTGPSMPADASSDPAGIGVFAVSAAAPADPQKSTVYFDETLRVWRGWDGDEWVDFVGGAVLHNSMPDLQGGTGGQYYHFTVAEHDGLQDFVDGSYLATGYVERLRAKWGSGQAIHATRESTEISIGSSAMLSKHRTSGDMVDGFGAGYLFAIEDNAGVENLVAGIYGVRDGADNTGALVWKTALNGTLAERMRLSNTSLTLNAGLLNVQSSNAAKLRLTSASTVVGQTVTGRASLGTLGAPSAIGAYYSLLRLIGQGHGETGWSGDRAFMDFTTTENWTDAAQGIRISWYVTPNGTVATAMGLQLYGDGSLRHTDGAAAAPSLSFLNEITSGMYRIGAGVLGWSIAGVERLRLSATALTAANDVDAVTGKLQEGGNDLIPAASANGCMFVGWSGSIANIPAGWQLCDGTNSTPDLRGRFIVGVDADSGGSYPPGGTGGAASVALTLDQIPSHNHTASCASDGSHHHHYDKTTAGSEQTFGMASGGKYSDTATSSDGSHSHSVTIGYRGGSGAHENRPPYYAACWVGRVR